jgi:hypothetical protein
MTAANSAAGEDDDRPGRVAEAAGKPRPGLCGDRAGNRIGDIAAQTEQVLRNLRTALEAASAGPEHVVKWNILVVEARTSVPAARRSNECGETNPILRSSRPPSSRASPIPTSSSRWTRSPSFLPDRRLRGAQTFGDPDHAGERPGPGQRRLRRRCCALDRDQAGRDPGPWARATIVTTAAGPACSFPRRHTGLPSSETPPRERPWRARLNETPSREGRSRTRFSETGGRMSSQPIWSAAGQRRAAGPSSMRHHDGGRWIRRRHSCSRRPLWSREQAGGRQPGELVAQLLGPGRVAAKEPIEAFVAEHLGQLLGVIGDDRVGGWAGRGVGGDPALRSGARAGRGRLPHHPATGLGRRRRDQPGPGTGRGRRHPGRGGRTAAPRRDAAARPSSAWSARPPGRCLRVPPPRGRSPCRRREACAGRWTGVPAASASPPPTGPGTR